MDIFIRSTRAKAMLALAFMLALACLLPLASADGSWGATSAPVTSGDYTYTYDDVTGEATITKAGAGLSGEIAIPSSLDERTVVAIGDRAFYSNSRITAVTIPSTIRTVGNEAFYYSSIASATFIEESGNGAFSIGEDAFSNSKLKSISLPATLESIGENAFGMTLIETAIIPDAVSVIPSACFDGCTSLESVTLPGTLTVISSYAFDGCASIEAITVPDSVQTLGSHAFHGCTSLKDFNGGGGIETIEMFAFYGCTSLVEFNLPDSVTGFGSSAFSGCTELTAFHFGRSLTTFSIYAFDGDGKFETITVDEDNEKYYAKDGILYDKTAGAAVFAPHALSGKVVIDDGIASVSDHAFEGRTRITEVVFPIGFTTVGMGAFNKCTSLAAVTFSDTVATIGESAFPRCTSLTSIVLPDSLRTLGNYAFNECTSLESVTIPASMTSAGRYIFNECTSLESVTFKDGITTIAQEMFIGCTSLESVSLPSSVVQIRDSAFKDCTSLSNISIPSTVTGIGGSAFSNCPIATITIPEGVTSIKYGTFMGCSSLQTVNLPSGIESIGSSAFEGCSSLQTFAIPEGVNLIESETFMGCSSLHSVTMPSMITSIGSSAFEGCYSLRKMIVPEGTTSIGSKAFKGCSNIVELTLPSTLTRIETYAFSDCDGIMSLTIPSGVTTVGSRAFENNSIRVLTNHSSLQNYSILGSALFIQKYVVDGEEDNLLNNVMFELIERDGFLYAHYIKTYAPDTEVYELLCYVGDDIAATLPSPTIEGVAWTARQLRGFIDATIPSGADCGDMDSMFEDAAGLRSITFQEGFAEIPDNCFKGCISLRQANLPASLSSIGVYAFSGCDNLESVVFANGSTMSSMGYGVFFDCTSLSEVVLPASLVSIPVRLFYGCTSLEAVEIPTGVTIIESEAFSGCTGLKSISFPACVASIGEKAFLECEGIASVAFVDDGALEEIGENAFRWCTSMTEIHLPSSLETIGESAFSGCTELLIASIPAGVSSLPVSVFSGCTSLVDVVFEQGTGLESIGESAFSGCTSLVEFDIPSGVASIGNYAFHQCTDLTAVSLPDGLLTIGTAAFRQCFSLSEMILPDGLRTIGANAFYQCTLVGIGIPASTDSIGNGAFDLNHDYFTIFGESGSYAEQYAIDKRIPFEPLGGIRDTVLTVAFAFDGDVNPYLGLLVVVTGETDGSECIRAVGARQTLVLGLSDLQEYTVQIESGTGTVFGAVQDVAFEDGRAECEIAASTPRFDLTLSVEDPDGVSIEEGYAVTWFKDGRPVGDSNVLGDVAADTVLSYHVVLGRDLSLIYAQPGQRSITVDGDSVVLVLDEIEMVSIDCNIFIDGMPTQNRVVASAICIIDGRSFSITAYDADRDGIISIEVPSGCDVSLSFNVANCHDFTEWIEGIPSDMELDADLSSLDEGLAIPIFINEIRAIADGETERIDTAYLGNYSVEVVNTTSGIHLAPSVRHGAIYLRDGDVQDGDTLEVVASDIRGMFLPGTGEVTFLSTAVPRDPLIMNVLELGGVRVEQTGGDRTDAAMLFDGNGDVIKVSEIGEGILFGNLPEGDYSVVFISDGMTAGFQSMGDLAAFGFEEGVDYNLASAEVANGVIVVVSGAAPATSGDRIGHLDLSATSMGFNKSSVSAGEDVMLRIGYGFDAAGIDGIGDAILSVAVPDGLTYRAGSAVSIDGRMLSSTLSGGVVRVEVGDGLEGAVLLSFTSNGIYGVALATGSIEVEVEGSDRVYPIGSDSVDIVSMELEAPDATSELRIFVIGKTSPDTVVDIFVDGDYSATVASNRIGVYQSWIQLPVKEGGGIRYYDLQAQAFLDDGATIRSPVETVAYQESSLRIREATLNAATSVAVDYIHPPFIVPVYSFARGSYLTFAVEIDVEDASSVSDVRVIVENRIGTVPVPCEYNRYSGLWHGRMFCIDETRAPTSMAVSCLEGIIEHKTFAQPLRYILDPSGVVYEGVPSNPLDGVTATLYQKVGGSIIRWDAEAYGQANPVITGADGYYEWYVPEGLWMVEYRKDGYLTAYSDWMEVPPPRTNVDVCMISTSAPSVSGVTVNSGTIDIVFSQYMSAGTVVAQNVVVTIGGTPVAGAIVPVDAETSPINPNIQLAKVFRFTPATELSGTVGVRIGGAANYAGNAMQSTYEGSFVVEPEVEAIEAPEDATAYLGRESNIPIRLDASVAGKAIDISCSTPGLLEVITPSVTTDSEGRAVVTVVGLIEGDVGITYVLRDAGISAATSVSVQTGGPVCENHDFGGWASAGGSSHARTCDVCGEVETAAHSFGEETVIAATCTAEGSRTSICAVCGHESVEPIPMIPHAYGEWEVTIEATESDSGERRRTCAVCDHVESEIIPAHPHDFSDEWGHDATTHFHACECGSRTDSSAHEYGEWVVVEAATEDSDGEEERTCGICGYVEKRTVPKTGSDGGDGLSGGAIAGIAIGSLAAIGAAGFLVFRFVIGRR